MGCLKQSAKDVRRKFLGSHRQQIQKRPWLVNEASSSQTLMSQKFNASKCLCNTSGTNAVGWEGRRRYNKTVKSSKAFYIAPYAWTWLGLYRVGGATYGPNLADFMPSFEKESAMPLTLLSAQRYLQIGNAPLNFEAACIMSCCLRPRQTH